MVTPSATLVPSEAITSKVAPASLRPETASVFVISMVPTLSRKRRVASTDSMLTGPISWPVLESKAVNVAEYPFSVSLPTRVLSSGAFMFTSAYTSEPEGTVCPGRDTFTPATLDSAPDQFLASVQVVPSAV